jgi:hypothetical protein
MKVLLIAAVAVAVSGAAFAKDLKGSVMTDSEMDKVTAGTVQPHFGAYDTATTAGHSQVFNAIDNGLSRAAVNANPPNSPVGNGICTAGHPPC